MAWVVDGSFALAWALPDESSDSAAAFLEGMSGEEPLLVPSLWWFELSNGLVMAQRRKRLSEADASRALDLYRNLPVLTDEGAGPDLAWRLQSLAREHGLTAYDAAYLELALRRAAGLATLDDTLAKAAAKAGVETVKRR